MIEEQATVVEVEGDLAWVESGARSGCGGCAARQGCGTGALGQWLRRRARAVPAVNPVGARVGERVVIGLAEEALLRGSLLVYLSPLLGMLGLGLLGERLALIWGGGGAEPLAMLGGLVGLVAGLVWARSRSASREGRFQPVVLRRLGSSSMV